ncbi:hypothetical protein LDK13_07550 [Fusobacterium animalis]|uniref:hypothetical protein n=1 Tax=Fusobacterium animalis TaxID=76859 RepID=UPI0004091D05
MSIIISSIIVLISLKIILLSGSFKIFWIIYAFNSFFILALKLTVGLEILAFNKLNFLLNSSILFVKCSISFSDLDSLLKIFQILEVFFNFLAIFSFLEEIKSQICFSNFSIFISTLFFFILNISF